MLKSHPLGMNEKFEHNKRNFNLNTTQGDNKKWIYRL